MEKMRQITIRPAVEDDLEAFLKLGEAIGNPPGVWKNNSKSDFHDLQERMKEGEKIFLLAIIGHKIIGFVVIHLFRRLDPTGYDPKSCTVGVVVHPGYRKQGIGARLVRQGLKEAKTRGIETAYISTGIENIAMQKLAEKLGFTQYAIIEKEGWRFPRYKRRIST